MKSFSRIIGLFMVSAATLSQAVAAPCLFLEYDGIQDYWVNQCAAPVTVNWSDAGPCKNWACTTTIPPKGREKAGKFVGRVTWCECSGAGCSVRGDQNNCLLGDVLRGYPRHN
jgi:hypothetical protein